jgi:integrase
MADGTGAKLAARWQAGADSLAAAHGRATASARADLEAVAAMLGHSSTAMTQRHYARVGTGRLAQGTGKNRL